MYLMGQEVFCKMEGQSGGKYFAGGSFLDLRVEAAGGGAKSLYVH